MSFSPWSKAQAQCMLSSRRLHSSSYTVRRSCNLPSAAIIPPLRRFFLITPTTAAITVTVPPTSPYLTYFRQTHLWTNRCCCSLHTVWRNTSTVHRHDLSYTVQRVQLRAQAEAQTYREAPRASRCVKTTFAICNCRQSAPLRLAILQEGRIR